MNPRKTISEDELKELAANIAKQGLLQPITVRPIEYYDEVVEGTDEIVSLPTKYEIVCGERRFRAVSLNADGKDVEVSCIVREMTDSEAFDAMITENLQRKDVDPIEEAFAFGQLKERGQDVKSIAAKFGKSERYILDRIKLSQLTEDGKKAVQNGRLSLAGAILISKLDKDKQDEFFKSRSMEFMKNRNISTSDVKDYIADMMRDLSVALWVNDDEWDEPSIHACNTCTCNTMNYGCLFWEMKGETPKCTNAACFRRKQEHYVMRELFRHLPSMVRKGEPLEYGKMVIVDDGRMTSPAAKAFKEEVSKIYEIVPESYFDGKSWYDPDDERVTEGLENHTMYMGVYIHDYNSPCFRMVPYKVKVKASTSTKVAAEPKEVQIDNLERKKQSIREDMQTQSIEKCKDLLKNRSYFKLQGDLSVVERLVLDVIMLRGCSQDFRGLHGIGVGKEFDFAKEHQSMRIQWVRDFIRSSLTKEQYIQNEAFRDSIFILIHEQYPEDFKQIGAGLKKMADKKIGKIDAQIEELKK